MLSSVPTAIAHAVPTNAALANVVSATAAITATAIAATVFATTDIVHTAIATAVFAAASTPLAALAITANAIIAAIAFDTRTSPSRTPSASAFANRHRIALPI